MPVLKYRDGYPDMVFMGFRMQFGRIMAVLYSAKMQALAGVADPAILKARGEAPTIHFWSSDHMERIVEQRKADNLNVAEFEKVLEGWPAGRIPPSVEYRVGED